MTESERRGRCPGCGVWLPAMDGPTHPYIGASPMCWAVFGVVMAHEYGEYGYPPVHALTVDAYAAQHPGTPSRRAIQSVAAHLIGLYLVFERGYEPLDALALRQPSFAAGPAYAWLDPPADLGPLTIVDVAAAQDLEEHERRVRRWAEAVWTAWAAHHEQIRAWASHLPPALAR